MKDKEIEMKFDYLSRDIDNLRYELRSFVSAFNTRETDVRIGFCPMCNKATPQKIFYEGDGITCPVNVAVIHRDNICLNCGNTVK